MDFKFFDVNKAKEPFSCEKTPQATRKKITRILTDCSAKRSVTDMAGWAR